MPVGSVSLRNFILGVLAQQPMSGYDISCVLENLDWLINNPSFGSIYSNLHALLQEGLVTVEVVHQQSKPTRKVYSITEAGRQVLQEWATQPIALNASLKAFVMRLVLSRIFSPTMLIAQLHQRRAQVATHRTELEKANRIPDDKTDLRQRLGLEYGLALATAELAWLDSALNQLSQQTLV
ncbi:MAG: PadR family transcriptional regulator [Anaerolineae bacterium]|jgi:DNA-binding PadR family transcriptional regulator